MTRNNHIGDFDGFEEAFLGLFDVVGAAEDASLFEVFGGGDGVAGDEGGGVGVGEQQAAGAGGVAGGGEQIDIGGEAVVGGLAFLQDRDVLLDQSLGIGEVGFAGGDGIVAGLNFLELADEVDADLFALGFADEPFGFLERTDAEAVGGAEAGEKDEVDIVGGQAGAFGESRDEGLLG